MSLPHALEPFLLLAKNAKGAAAAKLVNDALESNQVFVFTELMQQENVKSLETAKPGVWALLKVFCFGVWSDYVANQGNLPELTEKQVHKLKQLSLVTMASKRATLPYTDIQKALDLPSQDAVEQLIIDSLYDNLLQGQLDSQKACLLVDFCMGRDVVIGDADAGSAMTSGEVSDILKRWDDQVSLTMSQIKQVLDNVKTARVVKAQQKQNLEDVMVRFFLYLLAGSN
jgi:COP9 signalosome complex subunit 7